MMYMRKNIICLLALMGCLLIAGCNSGKKEDKRKEYIPLKMDVSSKDTVAVTQLSEKFMKLLQKGDYESALNMLYFLNKEGVFTNMVSRQYEKAKVTEGGSFGTGRKWKLDTVKLSERQMKELDLLFKDMFDFVEKGRR